MDNTTYTIDGSHFNSLDEFFKEVSSVLIPGTLECKSLDSFNDILRGDYGTLTRSDFTLIWRNADISRIVLGYKSIIAWRQEAISAMLQGLTQDEMLKREYVQIQKSFPERNEQFHLEILGGFMSTYRKMEEDLALAKQNKGNTIFDLLVEIIRDHPNVRLILQP
jgi:RNAse (barnase) inhibitor barstar